jgi:class 3 adenylate cyclase/tetratricopeptide (TPR) repeat protein
MADPQLSQLERLRRSMVVLESQRADLGDDAVDPALFALEQQIAVLEDDQQVDVEVAEDRRIVTILFTDIIGSSAIASRLDPEDWREVVAALHRMAGDTVKEFGGTVVQYLGDGLLALFGLHSSSERDPESAVCAALEIQEKVPYLEINEPVQLRAGINTGLVVTGELGSEAKREFTASGEAMNIASRLQEAAPAGGVLISHSTYRHIRGLFDMSLQFPLREKGRVVPIQTYLVTRFRQRPYRLASRGVGGVATATVGRETEIREIQSSFRKALKTNELVWTQLVGRPGVGKSRLISDFSELLEWQPEQVTILRAYAVEGDSKRPHALVRRLWFDHFMIPDDAPLSEMESLWVNGIQSYLGQDSEEAAHALGLLIGLPFLDSPHIGVMRDDPKQLKSRAFAVSRELFSHLQSSNLLILLIEDLHWADPSSWDYITQVVLDSANRQYGAFILAATRPEWTPSDLLLDHRGYHKIDLQPLSKVSSYLLATELLQRVELVPEKVLNLVADRSEGVPYFAEEIVNWFIDQRILDMSTDPWRFASTQFEDSPLPPTLQHLLQARLSALRSELREALQHGSIFGRVFWEGGLQSLGTDPVPATMNGLEARGFIEVQPTSSFEGEREWRFHHSLMRDVVYESILRRHRSGLHREAGVWLEGQAREVDRLEDLAGPIGEHAERAGEKSAAADWYLLAGKHSRAQGGLIEARDFFERTLELLSADDLQRRWKTLLVRDEVLASFGEPESRKEGLGAILKIAHEIEELGLLAEVYYRQATLFQKSGDQNQALELARSALGVAQAAGDNRLETLILGIMVMCLTRVGQLEEARSIADQLLLRSKRLEDKDVLVRLLTNVSVHYTISGNFGRAVELGEQQVAVSNQMGDRFGEAFGLGNLGFNYHQLGQFDKGRNALERALKLNEELGARWTRAINLLNLGFSNWRIGDLDTAMERLKGALTEFEEMGDSFGQGYSHLYEAFVHEGIGDCELAKDSHHLATKFLREIGMQGNVQDAKAGLARCALARGHLEKAHGYATELCEYLDHNDEKNMELPVWAYLTCASVFEASGDEAKARATIEGGHRQLMSLADKIGDVEWRESFVKNVPEHRALLEMWSRQTKDSHI